MTDIKHECVAPQLAKLLLKRERQLEIATQTLEQYKFTPTASTLNGVTLFSAAAEALVRIAAIEKELTNVQA